MAMIEALDNCSRLQEIFQINLMKNKLKADTANLINNLKIKADTDIINNNWR